MYKVEYFDKGKKHVDSFFGEKASILNNMKSDGKIVLSIKAISAGIPLFRNKVKPQEIFITFKAIADILSTGASLHSALGIVTTSIKKSSYLKSIYMEIYSRVSEGKNFSASIEPFVSVFGYTTMTMVKSGEASGRLRDAILVAANHMKKMQAIKKDLWKKLSYPFTAFFLSIGVVLFSSLFTIPRILGSEAVKMANQTAMTGLDRISEISINIFKIISYIAPVMLFLLIFFTVSIISLYKKKQESIEKLIIYIPFLRELIFYRNFYIAFFSLHKLLETNVPLDESLSIVEGSIPSVIIKKEFRNARASLEKGEHFAEGFTRLEDVEKFMLNSAFSINNDRLAEHISNISNRFYDQYINMVESVSPKVYMLSVVFVMAVFLMQIFAMVVPYMRAASSIR